MIEFQTIEFKWNSKWYHFIYYWFYNRWQKYIKKSNKWIGCCRGDASRPLKTKYTVEFVSDITKNQVCEIDNQLVDNLAIDLQKSIDDEIMNIDNDYFYSEVLNNLENELLNN